MFCWKEVVFKSNVPINCGHMWLMIWAERCGLKRGFSTLTFPQFSVSAHHGFFVGTILMRDRTAAVHQWWRNGCWKVEELAEQMSCVLMGGLCRMVRDNVQKTEARSKKPVSWADAQTQTEAPEEPAGPQQTLTSERRNSAEKELEFLQWNKLSFEEEPETWQEVSGHRVTTSALATGGTCHAGGRLILVPTDKQMCRDSNRSPDRPPYLPDHECWICLQSAVVQTLTSTLKSTVALSKQPITIYITYDTFVHLRKASAQQWKKNCFIPFI